MADEQFEAEIVDADMFDPDEYPPDQPMGLPELLGKDVLTAGDHARDSVIERTAREEPDFGQPGAHVGPPDHGLDLVDPDDPFGPDVTKENVGELAEEDDEFIDVLDLSDTEDLSGSPHAEPAEEAAMHIVDEG